jgi:hypothetical protein
MRNLFAVALALSLGACTLDLSGGDDDDGGGGDDTDPGPGPDPDPNPFPDPASARLIIGTNPTVTSHGDWADVWVSYPSLDCEAINLYGAQLPVLVDETFDRFVAASGATDPSVFVQGWLSLERDAVDQLWRVTAWEPEAGGTQPACYRW